MWCPEEDETQKCSTGESFQSNLNSDFVFRIGFLIAVFFTLKHDGSKDQHPATVIINCVYELVRHTDPIPHCLQTGYSLTHEKSFYHNPMQPLLDRIHTYFIIAERILKSPNHFPLHLIHKVFLQLNSAGGQALLTKHLMIEDANH